MKGCRLARAHILSHWNSFNEQDASRLALVNFLKTVLLPSIVSYIFDIAREEIVYISWLEKEIVMSLKRFSKILTLWLLLLLPHLHLLWNLTGTLTIWPWSYITIQLVSFFPSLSSLFFFFLVSHLLSFSSFPFVFSFLWEVSDICPTYFFMSTKAHLLSF